ncbi:hypothetical protein BCV69DRAFT_111764 [Microstroma glucosiphilum]|uniref:Zn(2)-C6 fungal-type domain-containing protein n=1 Tax=Pseudomicrostroma glucosiphilum TaxID=1684307 RepID=A0A316UGX9_9BASI|nr:hypothetical protein BCV69DRAFT_111764 [Pseudomicrostroma glucosiphilum]PWN23193.1 hypothetical protein BCV69DRAFT_111764 [Pseudomicrostroma glucosiphilum]
MLNHSCQRCRSKKLRCDGEQPCSNCAVKGLDSSCTRPLRKERPRRKDGPRQKLHIGLSSRVGHEETSSPRSSSENVSDGQIAPIVHSVAATSLGHPRDGRVVSPSGSHQSYPSPPVPGSASSYARSKVSSVRRTLTSGPSYEDRTMHDVASSSPSGLSKPIKSPAEQFTRAPSSMGAFRLTSAQVIEARYLLGSIPAAIRILKYIFAWRCQSTSHSAVHVPTLKRIIRQIYDDEWAQEVTQDQLCLLLMAIAISIQFAPRKGPYAHVWKLVEGMGPAIAPEERQGKLHYMARSIFESRLQPSSCTLEGVQTAMLLLLYDLDEDNFKENLFNWSIKVAKSLRLDHIGRPLNGVPTVENEMGTRVWWFLVCRDGLAGLSTGTFAIDPSQFTTRVPMLISDDDLAHGKLSNRIVAESSTVASSLPLINLAGVVRRLVDIKSKGDIVGQEYSDLVADAFDQYAEELPAIFSLGASAINVPRTGDDTSVYVRQRLETERWLLHQQIFHAYLQLYEIRLDVKVCDQVVGLALHILHLQDKVRDRCAIVDGLRINVTGVMRAITVMTIDLLQKHKNSKVSLVRQLTLVGRDGMEGQDEEHDALQLLLPWQHPHCSHSGHDGSSFDSFAIAFLCQ